MLVLFYVLLSFDSMGNPVLAQILVEHLAGSHCCYTAGALLSPGSNSSDDLCKRKGKGPWSGHCDKVAEWVSVAENK